MDKSIDAYQGAYVQRFRAVRPIFEKHFHSVDTDRIPDLVHRFTAAKEVGLYENWNYEQQQELLTKLRAQLGRAAESLSKIHKVVLSEVSALLHKLVEGIHCMNPA